FRLGSLIRFIPSSVITGFTTGIATVIFTSQVKDFFGMQISDPAVDFFSKLAQYSRSFDTINYVAFAVSLSALVIILFLRLKSRKIPGAIVAIIVTTLLATLLALPLDTIQSKFGAIPKSLPSPQLPFFSWEKIVQVAPDAIAIALLGAIESLLSCLV